MFVPKVSEYQATGAGAGVSFSQFMSASSLSSRFDGFSSDLPPIDETLHEQRGIHYLKSMVYYAMAKSCQSIILGAAPQLQNTFMNIFIQKRYVLHLTPALKTIPPLKKFKNTD